MQRFDVPRRSDAIDESAAQLRGAARDLDARVAETTTAQVFYDDAVRKFEREKPRPGRILGGKAPEWEGERDYREALRKQATTRDKLARLQAARRELEPKVEAAMRLRHEVEEFLKGTPLEGEPMILRTARPVKLAANPHAQIETLRQEIAATVSELEDVRRRPLPLEEALEVLGRSLERTAFRFHDSGGSFCAPDGAARELSLGEWFAADRGGHVDFGPCLAAVFRDQLREFFATRIAEFLAKSPPGLPRAARTERVAHLERRAMELEAGEEALVRLMEKQQLPVTRRPEAKPALVLAWDVADLEEEGPKAAA